MKEIKLEKRYPDSRDEDVTDAFASGYSEGYSAGLAVGRKEAKVGWILCNERMPEAGKDVLITSIRNTSLEVGIAHLETVPDLYWFIDVFASRETEEVIAWMPLPEPYREEATV